MSLLAEIKARVHQSSLLHSQYLFIPDPFYARFPLILKEKKEKKTSAADKLFSLELSAARATFLPVIFEGR